MGRGGLLSRYPPSPLQTAVAALQPLIIKHLTRCVTRCNPLFKAVAAPKSPRIGDTAGASHFLATAQTRRVLPLVAQVSKPALQKMRCARILLEKPSILDKIPGTIKN